MKELRRIIHNNSLGSFFALGDNLASERIEIKEMEMLERGGVKDVRIVFE
jgi:hypothetical protein